MQPGAVVHGPSSQKAGAGEVLHVSLFRAKSLVSLPSQEACVTGCAIKGGTQAHRRPCTQHACSPGTDCPPAVQTLTEKKAKFDLGLWLLSQSWAAHLTPGLLISLSRTN